MLRWAFSLILRKCPTTLPWMKCYRRRVDVQDLDPTLGRAHSRDRWSCLRYEVLGSLTHAYLWQWKKLATASSHHREQLPLCRHSQQEGTPHFSQLSAQSDGLLYTSDGLEQGCQTLCWTAWGSQTHSASLTLPSWEGWTPGEKLLQLLQLICQHLGVRQSRLLDIGVGMGYDGAIAASVGMHWFYF